MERRSLIQRRSNWHPKSQDFQDKSGPKRKADQVKARFSAGGANQMNEVEIRARADFSPTPMLGKRVVRPLSASSRPTLATSRAGVRV